MYPGPKPKPFIGNVLEIPKFGLHRQLEQWYQDYGDPYEFRLGPDLFYVSAEPDWINYILKERPDTFAHPIQFRRILQEMSLGGIIAAEGEDWQQQRKVVTAALKPGVINQYIPTMVDHAKKVISSLPGYRFDPMQYTEHYTLMVTLNITFGQEVADLHLTKKLLKHLKHFFPILGDRVQAIIPWWRYLPTNSSRRMRGSIKGIKKILDKVLQKRHQIMASPNHTPEHFQLIDHFIANDASEDMILANALTMMLAGKDTTANTLTWAMHYLAKNPELQLQLREESKNNDYSIQGLNNLVLHEAVVHETLRLKPPAPYLILEANHDTQIPHSTGPQSIRAGQKVVTLIRECQVAEQHAAFGREFHPQSWLDKQSLSPKCYYPFSGGPRFCPGRYLAILESKIFLAELVKHYDLQECSKQLKEVGLFSVVPQGMRIRRRDAA